MLVPSHMSDCLLPDDRSCLFLCAAMTQETTPASMEATALTESCPVTVRLASLDTGREENDTFKQNMEINKMDPEHADWQQNHFSFTINHKVHSAAVMAAASS